MGQGTRRPGGECKCWRCTGSRTKARTVHEEEAAAVGVVKQLCVNLVTGQARDFDGLRQLLVLLVDQHLLPIRRQRVEAVAGQRRGRKDDAVAHAVGLDEAAAVKHAEGIRDGQLVRLRAAWHTAAGGPGGSVRELRLPTATPTASTHKEPSIGYGDVS